jgi:alkyldihydroxyacetonephosphate synthase
MPELRWWGWGTQDTTYPLDERPHFLPFLNAALGLTGQESGSVVSPDQIALPASRLAQPILGALADALGPDGVSTTHRDRLLHACGKSYRDLVRLRAGQVERAPDAVAFPTNEQAVLAVLRLAQEHGFSVVPFGGGTSVTGGVEPLGDRPVLDLDLRRLDQVLAVDPVSRTATVQAGILGPALEAALNVRGFTLGHFPQSWEFSSLGGWIATRSAGQQSTGYGKIEDMVVSLTVMTPSGLLDTRTVPASAAGPSLRELLVGSEGTLGVITRATLRLRPLPAASDYRGVVFHNLAAGAEAIRDIVQAGLHPVTLRLSDPAETHASLVLQRQHPGFGAWVQAVGKLALARLGYDLRAREPFAGYDDRPVLLILGCEGEPGAVRRTRGECLGICRRHGGFDLGRGVGRQWYAERFALPYLRDVLLDRGVLTDTLETATVWSNLLNLHGRVRAALREAGAPFVMCHVSHVYLTGASLYFTFLARQDPGREIPQWQTLKRAATDCIMANGGTLTHHHGVGYEHAPWLPAEDGERGIAALRGVKAALDPTGIMNPGKLLPS